MSKRTTIDKSPTAKPEAHPAYDKRPDNLQPEETQPEDTQPDEVQPEAAPVTEVLVSAVHGDLRHLFTNAVFTKYPQKVELDSFLQAQLDAGKLQLHDAE